MVLHTNRAACAPIGRLLLLHFKWHNDSTDSAWQELCSGPLSPVESSLLPTIPLDLLHSICTHCQQAKHRLEGTSICSCWDARVGKEGIPGRWQVLRERLLVSGCLREWLCFGRGQPCTKVLHSLEHCCSMIISSSMDRIRHETAAASTSWPCPAERYMDGQTQQGWGPHLHCDRTSDTACDRRASCEHWTLVTQACVRCSNTVGAGFLLAYTMHPRAGPDDLTWAEHTSPATYLASMIWIGSANCLHLGRMGNIHMPMSDATQ